MKKIYLFFVLISIIFLSSCKKDNNNIVDSENDIKSADLSKVTWFDNTSNPFLTFYHNQSNYGPYYGRVLYDNGIFKMWYANSWGSDRYSIGYAESVDGKVWTVVNKEVLSVGSSGSFDSYSVHPGAVIKDGNVYKMYYCGQTSANDANTKRIGLATSPDGINWTRSSLATVNQINLYGYTTDILKVNGTYFLYYGNSSDVGVLTSTDGLNWTKRNPLVVNATQTWEGSRIWSSSVIYDDDQKFKMVYTNRNFDSFGYAESNDGINWVKANNPIFTYANTYNHWPFDIRYPFLRKVKNTYYIYYSTVDPSYLSAMGVITAQAN